MTAVFHRNLRASYPIAASGDGCYIIDDKGKKYLDGCSGAAVDCLGHSHPKVIRAVEEQVKKLAFAHSSFFTNEPMERLAETLIAGAPEGLKKVWFVSGGSEAVESSIKLARQYFMECGKPSKWHVIGRWQSYHGNTLGALAVGGNQWRRTQFAPLLVATEHVSPCYAYRGKLPGETDEAYGARLAKELEDKILELGPETVAAFIAEPVVGATTGCVTPVAGYFKRIAEVCKKYDVLLILDEVMCGMGRTGTLYACEQEGITADIITIAKGLGAGYQPVGAMLVSGAIVRAIESGAGFFQHGHTYMGHPVAMAAALAVQQVIEEENLLAEVRAKGKILEAKLRAALEGHPHIGDIRGRGLFYGVELVENRETKAPFPSAMKLNAAIRAKAMEEGLLLYAMGGTLDGKEGDHLMLAPPFIVTEAQLDFIVHTLVTSLQYIFREKEIAVA